MGMYIPDRDLIHPSWIEVWGERIGSTDVAVSIAENERLTERTTLQVLRAAGIDPHFSLPDEEARAIAVYAEDPERLERLCGLIVNGSLLRHAVTREDFERLANTFDIDEMRIAASLSELHAASGKVGIDMEKLELLITRSGKACIHAWKSSLHPQSALRLRVMENANEPVEVPAQSFDPSHARAIVNALVSLEETQTPSLAA